MPIKFLENDIFLKKKELSLKSVQSYNFFGRKLVSLRKFKIFLEKTVHLLGKG